MSYPPPGETVIASRRNVEFGTGRPADEPAPPELGALFVAWRLAEDEEDQAYMAHDARAYDRRLFRVWLDTQNRASTAYGRLAKALKQRRHCCFVINNCRFWWHVEHEGCRRESVRWEPVQ